jgi:V/A-type H+-transporting ATPase subunit I
MIVKMKKMTLLCTPTQQEQTLKKLRELKVVHVEHVQAPEGSELDQARNHLLYVQRAKEVLEAQPEADPTGKDPHHLVDTVWKLIHKEKELQETLQSLEHEHARIGPFGEFDPRELNKLNTLGIVAKLYELPVKDTPEAPDGVAISEISRDKTTIYVLAVGREDFTIPAHEVRVPDQSHSELHHHIEKTKIAIEENNAEFQQYAGDRKMAEEITDTAADGVTYLEVLNGMGTEDVIVYLKGFYPIDREDDLVAAAQENGWGYQLEEASAEDEPPTLLRNPKWVSPVKAALDLIDVVPGYKELDVSALFLIFLSIFFAFIVGDGGYGLLFLGLTLFGKVKTKGKKAVQPGLNLLLIMSSATIIFGALTGNFFGIPTDKLPVVMQKMTNPYMTGWTGEIWDSDLAANNIMFICFSLAVVHLSIAHLWNIVRKINSAAALIDLGWLFCTWSLYTIVLELVLDVTLYAQIKTIQIPLLGTGVGLVALGLLLTKSYIGIITLFLDVISNFVDIISYIRLYAVGAASLAVAQAFNGMALGDDLDGKFTLGAALILFAGHTLNIVLAAMGVMVHGIRLNTLEFSGHAGVEWAGIHYNPFRKKDKNL